MPARRPFPVLWLALIPVLVCPLYGQTSCNRTCPASSNPCVRSVGRSIETGQCLYANTDGATCDSEGVAGTCSGGQCIASECAGNESYGICDNPINLAEVDPEADVGVGACVEDLCIAAVPHDECVKVDMGRISCCEPDGCKAASGAYCTPTQRKPNGTSCDPLGVEPSGEPGLDGICDNGACVAQTGLCAGVECRTTFDDPCVRRYCDPNTGQCAGWPVGGFPGCVTADGFSGVCSGGSCFRIFDPDDCDVVCDDGNSCTDNLCIDRVNCEYRPRETGEPCLDGESGQCFRSSGGSSCLPVLGFCPDGNHAFCNDNNECTADTCEITCRNRPLDDGTPCDDGLGMCRSGVCVPDLCIGRDCSDGDSCTDDVCISPYGICDNPTKANGEPCDGEPGECIFGNCAFNACTSNSQCDDGNDCTINTCDLGSGLCSSQGKPSGAPCTTSGGAPGECRFGRCQAVFGGF